MKVLIISDFGSPYGGAERFLDNMLETRYDKITFYRINIIDLVNDIGDAGYLRKKIRQLIIHAPLVRSLEHQIKKIVPDIIHLNSNNLYTNSISTCLRAFHTKIVYFIHDYCALKRINLQVYTHFSRDYIFLTHSPDVYHSLVMMGKVAHLVKVPFNREKWLCSEKLLNRDFTFEILYVGRLEKEKGIFKLVQAMEMIKDKIPSIHLTMIGDGSKRKEIEKLIAVKKLTCNIIILGLQPDEEIFKYYRSCRLLIFPSPEETLGYVALEAQACGIPIVAFNQKSVSRWCHDQEHGFIVQNFSASTLAVKVIEIFDNKELLQRVSKAARRSIQEERYNATQCDISDVYTSILAC